jgi:hypothetical protein
VNNSGPTKNSSITVVIAGNTYSLRVDDPKSLRDMPADDRDQLIAVLDALKVQRDKSLRVAQAAVARSSGIGTVAQSAVAEAQGAQPGERLGKGDVDAIMARLIMEERQKQKPGLQRSTIYKIAAAIVVLIILLSVF